MIAHSFSPRKLAQTFIIFFASLLLVSQASAQSEELVFLCAEDEGIAEIIDRQLILPKPDKFQIAALENVGRDANAEHAETIRSACKNILETPEEDREDSFVGLEIIRFEAPPSIFSYKQKGFHCSASWDKDCKKSRVYQVPPGMQACDISYSYRWENREEEPKVTPEMWYNGDPESPDRFRAFKVTLKTEGNGKLLTPLKGKLSVYNVVLHAIPAKSTNKDRFESGCKMPSDGTDPLDDIDIPPTGN